MLIRAVSSNRAAFGSGNISSLRNANELDGKFFSDLELRRQLFQFFRRKRLSNVHHRGQAHVGLVVPIEANSLVIAHSRKVRFDLTSRDFESSGKKSFDDVVDGL